MSLNQIKLSPFMTAELFSDQLVTDKEKDSKIKMAVEVENKWKWLGDNQKQISIIVENNASPFLPDEELSFLIGILSACKLTLADVVIINHDPVKHADYKELIRFFNSRIVILFDISPSSFGLPMVFPHYQIQPFGNTTFLYTPALKKLETDKEEKRKLWTSLKRLFNI